MMIEDTDDDTLTYEWTQESLAESGELSDPTKSTIRWTVPITEIKGHNT